MTFGAGLRPFLTLFLCGSLGLPASSAAAPPQDPTLSVPSILRLQDLIEWAQKNSEIVQSTEKTIRSIEAEINARDLVLETTLASQISMTEEDRESVREPLRFGTDLFEVSLLKEFETGTQLSLTGGHSLTDAVAGSDQNIGVWEVRLSQALWQNAFGRSTRLRHAAELQELKARSYAALAQQQRYFVSLEETYWNLLLAAQEEKIRRQNLEQSEALVRWTKDRVQRSISEPSDLLQVQALQSSRRLEVIAAENRSAIAKQGLQQLLPDFDEEGLLVDLTALENERSLKDLIFEAAPASIATPTQLETLSAVHEAEQAEIEVAQVKDNLAPELNAFASYGQGGAGDSFSSSWERASDPNRSASSVGLAFSVELDSSLKEQRRKAAALAAEARALQAQYQLRESFVSWNELDRQHALLKLQAVEARRLSQLQQQKVQAERQRYRLGRSTVFQLTTFEIEAGNALVGLYQTLTELRKLESRARLFTFAEDQ